MRKNSIPVFGRNTEIERVIQIISRRTKNNPCLLGEPGVGKTAIAEGLAQRIISGDIPEMLQGQAHRGPGSRRLSWRAPSIAANSKSG